MPGKPYSKDEKAKIKEAITLQMMKNQKKKR
jgi:hypothetical protein